MLTPYQNFLVERMGQKVLQSSDDDFDDLTDEDSKHFKAFKMEMFAKKIVESKGKIDQRMLKLFKI